MELLKIPIRDMSLPTNNRAFDVTVDEYGNILRIEIQNVRGYRKLERSDIEAQIREALSKH